MTRIVRRGIISFMPKTVREHRNVKSLMGSVTEAWIGLKKSEFSYLWEWNDGVVENWLYWEPAPRSEDNKCITLKESGYINARPCSQKHYTVCQRPQKIIRDPILSTPVC